MSNNEPSIGFFEKYLTVWVLLCMAAGLALGRGLPGVPAFLSRFEWANVSGPIAVLIWVMIYPMALKVDFGSLKDIRRQPMGLFLTWVINWLIKPVTMFFLASFFFMTAFKAVINPDLARDYLAGAVLLGAAPCTAMVFVWSSLTKGQPLYTLVQVATNDVIILFAFAPIVTFLLGLGGIAIPYKTLFLSVVLFVVIPFGAGALTRYLVLKGQGPAGLDSLIQKLSNFTIVGLLLTLVLIFAFQAEVILANPLHILLIAIPLILQTGLIFLIAYLAAKPLGLPPEIAAPAALIGASNFFELAVAVAITVFGSQSPVALATVVGVLVEVPVMLILVGVANRTRNWFVPKNG
ncbi:MAG: ACR3 family arsenite efflux transporter [Deltaproteobacteria bacterium]|jgi:ACR3 family arsenite transporter|nr:ACR3 family arsenite efflux transporter [Deltaproteobacteria bacterium]